MLKFIYDAGLSAPYVTSTVTDGDEVITLFFVNPQAEAALPPWLREMLGNRLMARVEEPDDGEAATPDNVIYLDRLVEWGDALAAQPHVPSQKIATDW